MNIPLLLDTDEDEILEPLAFIGTDENNESSHDELEAEIKNLTKEIEKLREDIKSLESYQYNPPKQSTLTFRNYGSNKLSKSKNNIL